MPELGYAFSSEEHLPNDMVRHAQLAEEAGFTFGLAAAGNRVGGIGLVTLTRFAQAHAGGGPPE